MMEILSLHPGHDGQIVYIKDRDLKFSIEAEKDSWPRYNTITPNSTLNALGYVDRIPDIACITGCFRRPPYFGTEIESGYLGFSRESTTSKNKKFLGKDIKLFSSPHERSHIFCSYGLSPFPQGQPCYALVWEGFIGAFYKIDEKVGVSKIGDVVCGPGAKYSLIYHLANSDYPDESSINGSEAGKLMALTSYGKPYMAPAEDLDLIEYIISREFNEIPTKSKLRNSKYHNIGVESQEFKNFSKIFSDSLFNKFYRFAKENIKDKYPLLISGGCGLNCDWNSNWRNSGIFSDVFVPPCTNDSGVAIGTAIDAQFHYSGSAKINWSVYSGEEFIMDTANLQGIKKKTLSTSEVAKFLSDGNIIGWVQGRYEIGPRALGNRSILAMPFSKEIHAKLNKIKKRESYRPIAPICLEEDLGKNFTSTTPSPYMLYFEEVKNKDLEAITHVDNTARYQSVSLNSNAKLHELLNAFKSITNCGVLCNTSLNFNGAGFINRLSDLVKYAKTCGLDGFVVNEEFYIIEQ